MKTGVVDDAVREAFQRGRIEGIREAAKAAWEYRSYRAFSDTRHVKDERGMGAQRVYERIRALLPPGVDVWLGGKS